MWHWIIFGLLVVFLLALDLGLHREDKAQTFRASLLWSLFWIGISLAFNAFVFFDEGREKALEFFTGYLLEKSLSVDNLFVFILIFSYFKIEPSHQHRVLFWGVLGALVMRALFIFAGVRILEKFDWVMYLFGAFLIYTGVKMLFEKDGDDDFNPDKNVVVRLTKKFFRVSALRDTPHFFVREGGVLAVTSLFLALVCIEVSDLIFAVDSIPAVLSVSSDMYIVYTSNIFAILGLRSLYFVLNGVMLYFHYLKYALAGILSFIGFKMCFNECCKQLGCGLEISNFASLMVIVSLLTVSIAASVAFAKRHRNAD